MVRTPRPTNPNLGGGDLLFDLSRLELLLEPQCLRLVEASLLGEELLLLELRLVLGREGEPADEDGESLYVVFLQVLVQVPEGLRCGRQPLVGVLEILVGEIRQDLPQLRLDPGRVRGRPGPGASQNDEH